MQIQFHAMLQPCACESLVMLVLGGTETLPHPSFELNDTIIQSKTVFNMFLSQREKHSALSSFSKQN